MDKTYKVIDGHLRVHNDGIDISNLSTNKSFKYNQIVKIDYISGTIKTNGILEIHTNEKEIIKLQFPKENNDAFRLAKTYIWDKIKPENKKIVDMKETENIKEISCPKCKSTSLSANKKGFGIGKAITGIMLTGGIGILAGAIGSNKIKITCLKCGHVFDAGQK